MDSFCNALKSRIAIKSMELFKKSVRVAVAESSLYKLNNVILIVHKRKCPCESKLKPRPKNNVECPAFMKFTLAECVDAVSPCPQVFSPAPSGFKKLFAVGEQHCFDDNLRLFATPQGALVAAAAPETTLSILHIPADVVDAMQAEDIKAKFRGKTVKVPTLLCDSILPEFYTVAIMTNCKFTFYN